MALPPLAAFLVCTLIWGTTWIAIKLGYAGLDAVWGASLRFFLASLLLVPWILARRIPWPHGRRQVAVVVFVGLALFGADYGLIYWGEQYLSSGLTAVLFSTLPLFVAVYGAVLLPAERVRPRHVLGILLAIGGVVLLMRNRLELDRAGIGPMLAIVLSAAAAAISSVVVRRWGRDLAPAALNAGAMLVGALVLLAASLALGEAPTLPVGARAWGSLLYLVLFGSVVSFVVYWDLLKAWPAHRASLLTLLTPVVAVVTGYVAAALGAVDGEALSRLEWAGSLLVLAGVGVSLFHAPAARPRTVEPAPGK